MTAGVGQTIPQECGQEAGDIRADLEPRLLAVTYEGASIVAAR